MNVLMLTPDRVGSTLLQRLLTVYMLRKGFDKPVINLHELTNGLVKYYNTTLNTEVLGKPDRTNTDWGYFQTLLEVIELLSSANHYVTSRLAHYHIINRQDSIADQLKFYEYLNKNFYIIGCRRDNLFEQALSWEIFAHSKNLNVYDIESKVTAFSSLYKNKITASKESFFTHLERYKDYISWSNNYFNVQSYFNYDTNVHNIENYILNLDFMSGHQNNSWADMFNQDFNTWNLCHRMLPNTIIRGTDESYTKELSFVDPDNNWPKLKGANWPERAEDYEDQKDNLPAEIKTEITSLIKKTSFSLTESEYDFLKDNINHYSSTTKQLSTLVDNGFLVTNVPIKLQSLAEKRFIIKNFDECLLWYNDWAEKNNFSVYTASELDQVMQIEDSIASNRLVLKDR